MADENDTDIAAGILPISNDGKIFLGKRSDKVKSYKLILSVVGGHVQKNESLEDGARREFVEETGYSGDFSNMLPLENKGNFFIYVAQTDYFTDYNPGEEHAEENLWFRWFTKEEALKREDLSPDLRSIIDTESFDRIIEQYKQFGSDN